MLFMLFPLGSLQKCGNITTPAWLFVAQSPYFSVFDFLPVLLVCCLLSVDIWFNTTSGCGARNHKNMPLFYWFLGKNSGYMATPLIFWILGLSFSIWLSAGACQDNHTCPLLFSSHCLLTIRTWSVSLLVGDRGWGESGTKKTAGAGLVFKSQIFGRVYGCPPSPPPS